jgi:hypothetical protein
MRWILTRTTKDRLGTFGFLKTDDDTPKFLTLELPWKDNTPQISCIPKGEYQLKFIHSPKFGEVYQVTNVPNRDNILIHYGNYTSDIRGCILLGTGLMMLADPGISNSKVAFNSFMSLAKGQDNTLVII